MRTAFIETLCRLAGQDERIWLLCGDLGYSVLEPFAQAFPQRFVNAGVAEQNMIGIAAGLALCGKVVFTYSIANFGTLRCLEQIRNDVCYHRANVKIVAVGGGVAYGAQGYTHFAVEDLAVMRALPHMTVVAPGDPIEARLATEAIAWHDGPCYLRLGKAGEPAVYAEEPRFRLGQAIWVREGDDVTLVSTGAILSRVVEAARWLEAQGISAGVLSIPTVHPLDQSALQAAAARAALLCVIEEHHAVGGLGDAVARALAHGPPTILHFVSLDSASLVAGGAVGSQKYLLDQAGFSPRALGESVLRALPAKEGRLACAGR